MQASPGAGFGLFVSEAATQKQVRACALPAGRRWWWHLGGAGDSSKQHAVASFPLDLAITAANILRDPQVGWSRRRTEGQGERESAGGRDYWSSSGQGK
jgi:hypothetical protein